ncbi:MAG: two-component sensor histidine kinase [Desulfobacterales bacterium]|nr:two-component sensor histidine kinase [Desulfobacterales bacterium]MCF8078700.1 two-component sensor histidine kinase [Desulfobacterales bacterium]
MNQDKQARREISISFTRHIVLVVIIVSFTPMIVVSGIILDQYYTSYREKLYAHLNEMVHKHTQNIDGFLTERLNDIKFLSQTCGDDQLINESVLYEKLVLLQRNSGNVFEDLGIINEAGIQIAYAGPYKLEQAFYAEEEWFQEALQHQYYISDVFLGLRSRPHFIVSVRNVYQNERVLLRATINFEAFNALVENLRIGATGFAFIVNQKGKYQTRPHYDLIQNAPSYLQVIKKAEQKENGVYVGTVSDVFRNKDLIFLAAPLKNEDWMLVFQQEREDAYEDLKRTQIIAGIIIFVGALMIVLMNLFFFHKAVGRIAEADKAKEMMNRQVIETGKMASVGRLAAGIAHEINNPVAIMVEEAGWIDDLLNDGDFDECKNLDELKNSLKQINTQGKRCKDITHKLLSFARKTGSKLEQIQINDTIEEVIGLFDKSTYSRISFELNLAEELPPIYGSRTELQQVLLNLVNNAVYFLEKEGGTIRIATNFDNDNVFIVVEDNGPGIPKSNLERVFDPFFTTKPVGKGSGLGLAICYGIIKRRGGEITVSSAVDAGTSFEIRLPLGGQDQSSDNRPLPPESIPA